MALKMSDIAKLADVSKTAVSLAINNKPGVSEETRNKILKIIQDQGYKPLRISHKDRKDVAEEVTFLVVTTSGLVRDNYRSLPFFSSLISALTEEIGKRNERLRTVTIQSDKLDEQLSIMAAEQGEVGVLVLGTDLDRSQVLNIHEHLDRVVFLDTYYKDVNADFVTMDNYQGAYLAAEHIVSKGYKNIGYFGSEKLMANFSERRRGFKDALRKHGIDLPSAQEYLVAPTGLDPEGLNLPDLFSAGMPDAVFCEDDYIAVRVIRALAKLGVSVPKDIAVMGFDDIYEGTLITPELTTIHVPSEQMASQALHQLIQQARLELHNPQKTLVATTLVERKSL